MAPELFDNQPYDGKTDVWSLGCIAYELATFQRPFHGQSFPALVNKILKGKYSPLPGTYSANLGRVVEYMLKVVLQGV